MGHAGMRRVGLGLLAGRRFRDARRASWRSLRAASGAARPHAQPWRSLLRVLHAAQEVAVPAREPAGERAQDHRGENDRADCAGCRPRSMLTSVVADGLSTNTRLHRTPVSVPEHEPDDVRGARCDEPTDEVREQRLRREEVLEVKQRPRLDLARQGAENHGQDEA